MMFLSILADDFDDDGRFSPVSVSTYQTHQQAYSETGQQATQPQLTPSQIANLVVAILKYAATVPVRAKDNAKTAGISAYNVNVAQQSDRNPAASPIQNPTKGKPYLPTSRPLVLSQGSLVPVPQRNNVQQVHPEDEDHLTEPPYDLEDQYQPAVNKIKQYQQVLQWWNSLKSDTKHRLAHELNYKYKFGCLEEISGVCKKFGVDYSVDANAASKFLHNHIYQIMSKSTGQTTSTTGEGGAGHDFATNFSVQGHASHTIPNSLLHIYKHVMGSQVQGGHSHNSNLALSDMNWTGSE